MRISGIVFQVSGSQVKISIYLLKRKKQIFLSAVRAMQYKRKTTSKNLFLIEIFIHYNGMAHIGFFFHRKKMLIPLYILYTQPQIHEHSRFIEKCNVMTLF